MSDMEDLDPAAAAELDKIDEVLKVMRMSHDTRLLALALLSHGSALYQALVSSGIRDAASAKELYTTLLTLVLTPTKEKPRVLHVGTNHPRRLQ